MRITQDQTAFITGGASGIGLGLARACADRGMNVIIADIEQGALDRAAQELGGTSARIEAVRLDVADRQAVEKAARAAFDRYGRVDLVCNNAGVNVADPIGSVAPGDWKWIIDVNLKGVVHGVEAFAPLMREQGGGHIVNTASAAGLFHFPGVSPYAATKWAVVGMSEAWRNQLAPDNIGVSVLCPGAVATGILNSERNRDPAYGEGGKTIQFTEEDLKNAAGGIDPYLVGRHVLECVESNDLYIQTHAAFRPVLEMALERRLVAFEATRQSASMGHLPESALPDFF